MRQRNNSCPIENIEIVSILFRPCWCALEAYAGLASFILLRLKANSAPWPTGFRFRCQSACFLSLSPLIDLSICMPHGQCNANGNLYFPFSPFPLFTSTSILLRLAGEKVQCEFELIKNKKLQ